jgi:hypothetical protein
VLYYVRDTCACYTQHLLTDSLDCPIRPRTVRRSEMIVGAEVLLYVSHHGVLEVTALAGNPLLSHAKGSEPFDEHGCCTVSIRVLALLQPNVVAVVILDNQDILASSTDGPMYR